MASVQITIKDIDTTNIGVDINCMPQFPESQLLFTNAQLVARDLITLLQQLGKQINDRKSQGALTDAISV